MTGYRSFRNDDPPALAELWGRRRAHHALVQPVTPALLEEKAFSKPYFDRHGFIIAEDDHRIAGFAHAGFGCTPDGAAVDPTIGVLCLLMVDAAREDGRTVALELLARAEAYLRERGARTLLAGGILPSNPFYCGLYGYSPSPGVLDSDAETRQLLTAAGYQPQHVELVFQRELSGFRPIVDRQQIQHRRLYHVEAEFDPPARTWWEACTLGDVSRVRHRLLTGEGHLCGSVIFWDMARIARRWGTWAMGLVELNIAPPWRGQGLGTFLLGEALRDMENQGTACVVAQVACDNEAACASFRRLGFEEIDRACSLQKAAA